MKTLKGWMDSNFNMFEDYVQPGDQVDDETVDYFLNILPPKTQSGGIMQVGEPCSHEDNPKTNRWQATYSTFAKNENGWYWAGNCFAGEKENVQSTRGGA